MGLRKEGFKPFDKVIPVLVIPEYLAAFYTHDDDMVQNARCV